MTASWLPTWPTGWKDFHEAFKRWVPQEWPRGLYNTAGQAWQDIVSIADMMAYTRDLLEWILQSYHPQTDTEGLFLELWEKALGLLPAISGVTRAEWIVGQMRLRGTPTDANARGVVAAAFGSMDAADVLVCSPAPADVAAANPSTDDQWAINQYQIHFYSATETVAPNEGLFLRLTNVLKPSWEWWTLGRYKTLRYTAPATGEGPGVCSMGYACYDA